MNNLQSNPFDPSFGTLPKIMLPNYQSNFASPRAGAQAIDYGDPNRVIFAS